MYILAFLSSSNVHFVPAFGKSCNFAVNHCKKVSLYEVVAKNSGDGVYKPLECLHLRGIATFIARTDILARPPKHGTTPLVMPLEVTYQISYRIDGCLS